MPKAFTENDRARVRAWIVQAALTEFTRHGYRKTSVEDVARGAGVGKGTIYLFFESKAALFSAAAADAEARMRARLLEAQAPVAASPREHLRWFLRFQFEALATDPLLSILSDPLEAAAVFRDLPEAAADELRASDEVFMAKLIGAWVGAGRMRQLEPELLTGLLRALYAMQLHRDLIGESVYPAVVELLIDALSSALAPNDVGAVAESARA